MSRGEPLYATFFGGRPPLTARLMPRHPQTPCSPPVNPRATMSRGEPRLPQSPKRLRGRRAEKPHPSLTRHPARFAIIDCFTALAKNSTPWSFLNASRPKEKAYVGFGIIDDPILLGWDSKHSEKAAGLARRLLVVILLVFSL